MFRCKKQLRALEARLALLEAREQALREQEDAFSKVQQRVQEGIMNILSYGGGQTGQ